MTPFLQSVAEDLIAKHGRDLSRTAVVFPNRRAGLFFNEYLAQGSKAPVWAPRHLTISELFTTLSPLRVADSIETVCRIFRIYISLTHSDETLDRFYGWGERLLADFDDVDKNMADATRLFINVRDYNNIDYSIGTAFTEEQRKALQRFLVDFRETDESRLRRNFYALWDKMLPIYTQLNAELAEDGYAYEGALYRSVVEGLSNGHLKFPDTTDTYVFVGFNVLDEVERRLFSLLNDAGKARFYWDYDVAYCDEASSASEAGLFLRKNLAEFGNELPPDLFNNLLQKKDITFVAAPTENAQAFSIAPWLQNMAALGGNPRRTAVVLCNEELVEPVLHTIPSEVTKLNITKGFPLSHTPAFTLIERELADEGGQEESNADLLKRLVGLVRTAAEEAEARLRPEPDKLLPENAPWLRLLYLESYYEAHTTLERFIALTENGFLSVSATTLRRLLLQVLRQASVPFHGDPAEGIQVMGVLETRNLDFDNVLMLSVNEGMLPRPATTNSFIPYPLRKAYGLTDIERQTAVYAYYFYRLIQRASRLRMLYNNTSSGVRTAEMSRFMRQMLLSGKFNISTLTLTAKQEITEATPIRIDKPAGLRAMLNPPCSERGGAARNNALSPSALNRFVSCPVQFYFSRIARLKVPEPDSGEIQNTTFGELFHKAAELFYTEIPEKAGFVPPRKLEQFLDPKDKLHQLEPYVNRAFAELGIQRDEVAALTALECLRNLVRHDASLYGLHIIDTEKFFSLELPVRATDGSVHPFRVGGIIDRLDCITDPQTGQRTVRIVDYKTGAHEQEARTMEAIFTPADRRPYYFLQTFLYALAVRQWLPGSPFADANISCSLFYPFLATHKDYVAWVKFEGAPLTSFTDALAEDFRKRLAEVLEDLLDESKPFVQCEGRTGCRHCDFRALCGLPESEE